MWKQQRWSKVHRRNVQRRSGVAETTSAKFPIPIWNAARMKQEQTKQISLKQNFVKPERKLRT